MKTTIKLSILAIAFLMSSCWAGVPLTSKSSDNNKTYTVDYLFEHDGCKVYRFYDNGAYVYFTNCNSDITAVKSDSTRIITKSTVTYVKKDSVK